MLTEMLHMVGQVIQTPVIIILMFLIVVAIWQVGDLLVEYIIERRKFKENVPVYLKKMSAAGIKGMPHLIESGKLLKSQKTMMKNLIDGKDMSQNALIALAQDLLGEEENRYAKGTSVTDLVAKLGPMFGLLGTLIPLGPGIIALGEGDTATLAASIGIAFDTTIAGLLAAAICFVISHIRKRWYAKYSNANQAIMECLLDEVVTES